MAANIFDELLKPLAAPKFKASRPATEYAFPEDEVNPGVEMPEIAPPPLSAQQYAAEDAKDKAGSADFEAALRDLYGVEKPAAPEIDVELGVPTIDGAPTEVDAPMDFSDSPIALKMGGKGARAVTSYEKTGRKEKGGGGGKPKEAGETKKSAAGPMGEAEDALLKSYKDKAAKLGNERMSALERAAAEKDLSSEEKVAMALLAALPGLIGAIGGGAIGGGWGAAAGAAGGLQGGAQGIRGIAESKEGRRKEAKGDADKILEQIMQQDGLATRRQETLEGRDLDAKKTKEQREAEMQMLRTKEAGDDRRSNAQIRATLTSKAMDRKSSDYQAQLDAEAKRQGHAASPVRQAEKDFYANMDSAMNSISNLESIVHSDAGNWESRFGDPDAAAGLEQEAYKLAIAYAKIVDPTSVAREGEVEAAKKFMVPMGFTVPNNVTKAALTRMRAGLLQAASARKELGAPLPESVNAAMNLGPRQQSPATQGPDAAATTKQKYGF